MPTVPTTTDPPGLTFGSIVGIAIAAAVVLIIVVFVVIFKWKKRKSKSGESIQYVRGHVQSMSGALNTPIIALKLVCKLFISWGKGTVVFMEV